MTISLCGVNVFQRNSRLAELTRAFTAEHGDLALEKLDGEEASYEQILGAIESLPFLAAKKMVVVHSLSLNKEAAEKLEELTRRAGDTTDLIIVEAKLDKRSVYYKQLKKLTEFNEYGELDERQLIDWLSSEAKRRQAKLDKHTAQYLVQRAGQDQQKLSRELEKLIQYSPGISRDTIDALTPENPSGTIFNLIDSAFSGNLNRALELYEDQRRQRIEPQAIHAMLVWQMHAVAVTSAAPSDITPAQIASDSGMSPFVVQKSQRIARKMGRSRILAFIGLLRDIDYRGKHEPLDYDEALRYAITTLAFD